MSLIELRDYRDENAEVARRIGELMRLLYLPNTEADRDGVLQKLVTVSNSIGNARALLGEKEPFPHPMQTAEWVASIMKEPELPTMALSTDMEPHILGPIGMTFDVPNPEITEFARLYTRLTGTASFHTEGGKVDDGALPHWFRTPMHAGKLDAPGNVGLRGFRVDAICVQMPTGSELRREAKDRPFMSVPTHERDLCIDFTAGSAMYQLMGGEVWFAVSRNKRYIQLACRKDPRIDENEFYRAIEGGLSKPKRINNARRLPLGAAELQRVSQGAQLRKFTQAVATLRRKQESVSGPALLSQILEES